MKYYLTVCKNVALEDLDEIYLLNAKTLEERPFYLKKYVIGSEYSKTTYSNMENYFEVQENLHYNYIGTIEIQGDVTIEKIKSCLPEFFL